jgi:hypothetical protein
MTATANLRGAVSCTDFPRSCTVSNLQIAITDLIRSQNPRKTWAFVASMFGLKERAAKHRLANARAYTIEELQALIQSDNGLEYLEALMADATPRWWVNLQKSLKLSAARVLQEEAQQAVLSLDAGPMDQSTRRKTKRFFDADRNLTAARAKEEVAVGLLHQKHHRAMAGAMAQTQSQAQGRRR